MPNRALDLLRDVWGRFATSMSAKTVPEMLADARLPAITYLDSGHGAFADSLSGSIDAESILAAASHESADFVRRCLQIERLLAASAENSCGGPVLVCFR